MTFRELEDSLRHIKFAYDSYNYFRGDSNIQSKFMFEFSEFTEETELIIYVEYQLTDDRLIIFRYKFPGPSSMLEKHEREEIYKSVFVNIMKMLMFGKDFGDIRNISAGLVNTNWLHKDLPVNIPAEKIKSFNNKT